MLALSRKRGEKLIIRTPRGDVWITVVGFSRGAVRLGLEAPPEVRIDREERWLAQQAPEAPHAERP